MARSKTIAEQAGWWKKKGESLLLTALEEEKGTTERRGAEAIKGLVYLAYGEGMMEAKYGHPSKWPDKGQDYWGDYLFDSDIFFDTAGAIADGIKRRKKR
jgi:hypothetical protein